MAGARQTGKSFYVCIGIRQLQLLCQKQRNTMEFADEQTRIAYQTYYERPLLEERGLISPTPPADREGSSAREPMIWSLGMRSGQQRYLILRDVAGEDLESETPATNHLGFFAHADAVLFMFDPLRVPEIAAQLRDFIPQSSVGGDPQLVLNRVLRLIGPSNVRLGVIVSKFDAMEALRDIRDTVWSKVMSNSGAAFLRDPGIGLGSYDNADGELLHEEVRSLLLRLNAERLIVSLEQPNNGHRLDHRFFAVSVLGEAPRRERLHGRGITPHRCLDPLSWVLQ
jgi:hypothetical protein